MHTGGSDGNQAETFLQEAREFANIEDSLYKRSRSFPRRARNWPIRSWQVTGSDC